jgi:hypothetical protein
MDWEWLGKRKLISMGMRIALLHAFPYVRFVPDVVCRSLAIVDCVVLLMSNGRIIMKVLLQTVDKCIICAIMRTDTR